MASKKEMICRSCGRQGQPKKKSKGSRALELALWLGAIIAFVVMFPVGGLFAVVALVYSLWRLFTASPVTVCPACYGEATMIPTDTPEGQRIAASHTTPPILKRS